jgi:hypothetical protein
MKVIFLAPCCLSQSDIESLDIFSQETSWLAESGLEASERRMYGALVQSAAASASCMQAVAALQHATIPPPG